MTDTIECPVCGNDMPAHRPKVNKPRKYCSTACATQASLRRDAIAEDVEWLLSAGVGHTEIAARLKLKPGSVARALYRAGRPDLARPFNSLHVRSRDRQCVDCGGRCSHTSTRCTACGIAARNADPAYQQAWEAGMERRRERERWAS